MGMVRLLAIVAVPVGTSTLAAAAPAFEERCAAYQLAVARPGCASPDDGV